MSGTNNNTTNNNINNSNTINNKQGITKSKKDLSKIVYDLVMQFWKTAHKYCDALEDGSIDWNNLLEEIEFYTELNDPDENEGIKVMRKELFTSFGKCLIRIDCERD